MESICNLGKVLNYNMKFFSANFFHNIIITLLKSVAASARLFDCRILIQLSVFIPDSLDPPLIFRAAFRTRSALIDFYFVNKVYSFGCVREEDIIRYISQAWMFLF